MTANPPSHLDPDAIQRLRRLGGEKFAREMIDLFLTYVSERIAAARQACEGEDLSGVGGAVHAIKSSAGNAGATRVQHLAASVEQAAKEQDVASVKARLSQLEQSFAEVTPWLEAEKAKLAESSD